MLKGRRTRKAVAATLLLVFAVSTFAPTAAYALTSGPTAPEATSFEPVDTTDMVNTFTGGMTYNVPLLEVPGPEGGYPLSLSYHAGIQPDEDASWVGLGWTLNPGAVTRTVNGYPDDWDDVTQVARSYWSGGTTTTLSIGVNVGLGGAAGVGFGLSFSSDTYQGFGVGFEVSAQFAFISYNTETKQRDAPSGIGVSASLGIGPYGDPYVGGGASFGSGELSNKFSFNTNFKSVNFNTGIGFISLLDVSMSTNGSKPSLSVGGYSSFANNSKAGNIQTSSHGWGFGIPIGPVSIGLSHSKVRYWSDETVDVKTNGALHNEHPYFYWDPNCSCNDPGFRNTSFDSYYLLEQDEPGVNLYNKIDPRRKLGGVYPDVDIYNVTAQGMSGSFKPYFYETELYTQDLYVSGSKKLGQGSASLAGYYNNPKVNFRFVNDFSNRYLQGSPDFTFGNTSPASTQFNIDAPVYGYNDGTFGYDAANNRLAGSKSIQYFTNSEILAGTAKSKGFIDCSANGFSRTTANGVAPNQVGGFSITNESGMTYHYALPVYNKKELTRIEKISQVNGYTYNTYEKDAPYAYTWYLTSITGPDFVDKDGDGKAGTADWGYWVNFNYGLWTDGYVWRNPAKGMFKDLDNEFKTASSGIKELYYLNSIQTRTHTAIFEKDIRGDGIGYPSSDVYAIDNETIRTFWDLTDGSKAPMKLQRIYLLRNADAAIVNPAASSLYANHYGQNVIDKNDLGPIRASLTQSAIRIIEFNQDYSLAPYTLNTDPSVSASSGKLTLNAIYFRGKGGESKIPPMRFYYDLDPADQVTGTINISNYDNTKAEITFTTAATLNLGDIISFSQSGNPNFATYVRTQSGSLVARLTSLEGGSTISPGTANFTTTKNPGYYREAYDMWGMFKSDFDKNALSPNENLARTTTPVSAKSVDVWSLRKIKSPLCTEVKIEYESNTYSRSIMNSNGSFTLTNIQSSMSAGTITVTSTVDTRGYNVGDFFAVNDIVQIAFVQGESSNPNNGYVYHFIKIGSPDNPLEWYSYSQGQTQNIQNATHPVTVSAINEAAKTITLTTDIPFQQSNMFYDYKGGNLFLANKKNMYGGGARVKSLSMINTSDNSITKTNYNYNLLDNNNITSGVTSYLPNRFEFINVDDAYKVGYASLVYMDDNKLLSLSRELPSPGVMYEYVSVSGERINNGQVSRQVEGKTTYQFEVFNKNMVYVDPTFPQVSSNYPPSTPSPSYVKREVIQQVNQATFYKYLRNMTMRVFTGAIGNLKRSITFDKYGKKLTETINQYLHDDLERIYSTEEFYNQYNLRLAQYKKQGMVQERFFNSRYDWYDGVIGKELAIMNKREEYPVIMTGQTVIDYKTGTRSSSSNLEFDFYSGAVTKKLETNGYGDKFLSEVIPAYLKFPSLGLKDINSNNKNMLTQQAASYSYKVDANNNKLGVLGSNVQLWSDNLSVFDGNNSFVTQNVPGYSNTTGDVWRKSATYNWMPEGSTADNFTPFASFVDFNWNNPTASDANWKKTADFTLYDVYSNALESKNLNNLYAATKMGYNNSKVLISGAPVRYNEIAFSGAEDPLISGKFGGNVSPGVAAIINGGHTGSKCLQGTNGDAFNYSVNVNQLEAGRNYIALAWVQSVSAPTPSNAQIYYQVNSNTPVSASINAAKKSGNWYLLSIIIPGSAINGATTLKAGVTINNEPGGINIDDFRFQPVNSGTSAYVYDLVTGELTYTLDNNNLFNRYEYDGHGRLIRTYKETFTGGVFKTKEFEYNYCQPVGLFTSAGITNQPYYRTNCPAGQQAIAYNVTVPAGQFSSGISQSDADQQAQQYAQGLANTNGTCICSPSFSWTSGLTPIYTNISVSGTNVSLTLVVNYPSGSSSFNLGNITTSCCYPTAARVVPVLVGSSVFNVTISTTGNVQAQLISGPIPSGGVSFHGSFDLLATTYYSAAKSGTYTRNNCPAGQTGSSVTYNVPAYTYTSLTDQPTADQLAQTDVNNNGQNYANSNGTCATSCSFTPAGGITFFTSNISSSGSSASFSFAFNSPGSNYTGGTIGTINGGCRPSGTRTVNVTDGTNSSRVWAVTILSSGTVQIAIFSGPAANPGPPIVLSGTYTL